jgi:hypothetical protein
MLAGSRVSGGSPSPQRMPLSNARGCLRRSRQENRGQARHHLALSSGYGFPIFPYFPWFGATTSRACRSGFDAPPGLGCGLCRAEGMRPHV